MDARLRELERSAAQGDPKAGARLLSERVRAGELTASHLRLAALVGDPNALQACGQDPQSADLPSLLRSIANGWGKPAAVRAALALAWRAVEQRSGLPDPPPPNTLRALNAVSEWCQTPGVPPDWRLQERAQASALLEVGPERDVAFLAVSVLQAASADEGEVHDHVVDAGRTALRVLDETACLEAIRDVLVPWALTGEGPARTP